MNVIEKIEDLINDSVVVINQSNCSESKLKHIQGKLFRAKVVAVRERRENNSNEKFCSRIDNITNSIDVLLNRIKLLMGKRKVEQEENNK